MPALAQRLEKLVSLFSAEKSCSARMNQGNSGPGGLTIVKSTNLQYLILQIGL